MGRMWKRKQKYPKLTDDQINDAISNFLDKNNYKNVEEAFVYSKYMKTESWAKRRDAFLASHGGACELCGSKEKVQAHHNNYLCVGNEKSIDLIALCWECHSSFHKRVKAKSLKTPETYKKHIAGIHEGFVSNKAGRARARDTVSCSMCRRENLKYQFDTKHRTITLCDGCYRQFKNKVSQKGDELEEYRDRLGLEIVGYRKKIMQDAEDK